MTVDGIPLVYRTGEAHLQKTTEQHIFTLKSLPYTAEEDEQRAELLITFSTLIFVILTFLGFSVCIFMHLEKIHM